MKNGPLRKEINTRKWKNSLCSLNTRVNKVKMNIFLKSLFVLFYTLFIKKLIDFLGVSHHLPQTHPSPSPSISDPYPCSSSQRKIKKNNENKVMTKRKLK